LRRAALRTTLLRGTLAARPTALPRLRRIPALSTRIGLTIAISTAPGLCAMAARVGMPYIAMPCVTMISRSAMVTVVTVCLAFAVFVRRTVAARSLRVSRLVLTAGVSGT